MSIAIYLILQLTSCWICPGSVAQNFYKFKSDYPVSLDIDNNGMTLMRKIRSSNLNHELRINKNPNDPEYLKMAKNFVHSHLHIREEDIINITIYKVTTTAYAGQITRLRLRVFLVDTQSIGCRYKLWEQLWENVEHVIYCCESITQNKKINLDHSDNLLPDNPKYQELVKASLKVWFIIDDQKLFKEEDIKLINVISVKTQITSETIKIINFSIVTVSNEKYNCIGRIKDIPWDPEDMMTLPDIKCMNIEGLVKDSREWTEISITEEIAHAREVRDHNDFKYKRLATESAIDYIVSITGNNLNIIEEIKVKSVSGLKTKVHKDEIIYINFDIVCANAGIHTKIFNCSSVYENLGHVMKSVSLNCLEYFQLHGGSNWQDPSDAKFEVIANASLEKYLGNSGVNLDTSDIIVTFIVKRLFQETKYDIKFIVRYIKDHVLECNSSIRDRNGLGVESVNCYVVNVAVPSNELLQNPDELKYKYLAEESFQKYLKSHIGLFIKVRELKVTRVTSQVISGGITRIDFSVIPVTGETFPCHSEIWEYQSPQKKDITVICDFNKHQQPEGLVQQNPDEPKYKYLAEECFEKYQKSHIDQLIEVQELKVTRVTTQVVSGEIARIDFFVIPTYGKSFTCHGEIWEQQPLQKKNITVACDHDKQQQQPDVQVQQNPDDPRYRHLAAESFEQYRNSHFGISILVKEFRVTRVTRQVVSGVITRVDFNVVPVVGVSFPCHSEIWEHQSLQKKDTTVTCDYDKHQLISGGQVQLNPENPNYMHLAKESFEKYQKSHIGLLIEVREFKITRVTTQIISGVITRIDFSIIPVTGEPFPCHAEIWEHQSLQNKDITVICDYDKHLQPGGLVQQNPDEPKYRYLAEESFEKYQKSHIGISINVREIKVTRVTTQVVSGEITRIDFFVIPTEGISFICHSEFWEQQPLQKKEISVTCDYGKLQKPADPVQQNPDEPKYRHLAEESFEQYRNSHFGASFSLKEIKVTRVTTQVVSGVITRVDFNVIPVVGKSFSCHLQIWEHQLLQKKDITVTCDYDKHQIVPEGQVQRNPDDPEYRHLAGEAFEQYRNSHFGISINVKEFRVTRVTTQVILGVITRVDFNVIPFVGESFPCHSEIWEHQSLQKKDITVTCDYDDHIPGGQVLLNSEKYKHLAKESFEKYQKSHIDLLIEIRELKVTSVTTEVVSGVITRIHFTAIPVMGESFPCYSEIWEKQSPQNKDITVICEYDKQLGLGGLVQQNPHEQKYKNFAVESFNKYRKSHIDLLIEVQELKVTRVTTQVFSIKITRIDFFVIPTYGKSFICHSEILEQQPLKNKDISVICDYDKHQQPGGLVQQNPDDSKYRHLAEESFDQYRNSHLGISIIVKEFRVTRVTTQVISGVITRIDFNVIPVVGESFWCHSEIWEHQSFEKKNTTVTCDYDDHKIMLGGQVQQNPENQKYKHLAEESFEVYRKSHSDQLIKVRELRVTTVTTQVVSGVITRIDFSVIPVTGESFPCHSEIWEYQSLLNKNITVTCDYDKHHLIPGDQVQQNPDDPVYKKLAEESFQKYLKYHTDIQMKVKDVKVIRVTTQLSGSVIRIDFNLCPTNGCSIPCHSEIRKKSHKTDFTVQCQLNKHTKSDPQNEQDPTDPKYKKIIEESFEKYQTQIGLLVKVLELNVTRVTSQVVSGVTTTRIDFSVIPVEGESFPCHSEISEQPLLLKKDITVTCEKYQLLPSGKVEKNPDNPEYNILAEESFQKYMKFHTYVKIRVKDLKVAKVTTRKAVISIDFHVYTTKGHIIPCHSEISKKHSKDNITVECQLNNHAKPEPQDEQDPDDPKYKYLAEESFEEYRSRIGLYIEVHKLRVTKVTRQKVSGVITTRINFNVNPTDGGSFPCHSEIWEQKLLDEKEIIVTCSHDIYKLLPGGQVQQNSDNPEYKLLAEESFKKFLSSHSISIQVKGFKVNKVTTEIESGTVIRIDFHVYSVQGRTIPCHSEIRKKLIRSDFTVQCDFYEQSNSGGQEEQDSTELKYKYLAEESFDIYQTHNGLLIDVKELEVTRVTTQVVSGVITRIDFNVIPTHGKSFACYSQIWDKYLPQKKEITVKCQTHTAQNDLTLSLYKHNKTGGKKVQNPNDPKYKNLAGESFEIFLKYYSGPLIHVQKLIVTRVTTLVVSGIKTIIDFKIISTKNKLFTCHSEVYEHHSLQKKDKQFKVKCDERKTTYRGR